MAKCGKVLGEAVVGGVVSPIVCGLDADHAGLCEPESVERPKVGRRLIGALVGSMLAILIPIVIVACTPAQRKDAPGAIVDVGLCAGDIFGAFAGAGPIDIVAIAKDCGKSVADIGQIARDAQAKTAVPAGAVLSPDVVARRARLQQIVDAADAYKNSHPM